MYKLKSGDIEGKNYITCNYDSSTELGKLLHITHKFEFDTIVGRCNKIKNFLDYCVYENMDISHLLLNVRKVIKNKKKILPNYWGICVYVMYEKIRQHPNLKQLLKENNLPFTLFSKKSVNSVIGEKEVISYIYKLEKYIEIIEDFQTIIKEDKFNPENVNNLIRKYSVTDNLFEGTDFIMK